MKKSVLTVAIAAAAFAASAASAATVYDKNGTLLAVGGQIEVMIGNAHWDDYDAGSARWAELIADFSYPRHVRIIDRSSSKTLL